MTDLELSRKRVLIRADLNVPIKDGKVTSLRRLTAFLATLDIALKQDARIILMSHLGRPQEGEYDSKFSLAPVAECLSTLLKRPVKLIKDWEKDLQVESGEIILLENVRFLVGEKNNSPELAKKFAQICEIFVMDAFATSHRQEASTYGVAEYAKIACAGPLLVSEIQALHQIMANPAKPLVAIVAGSKVSTKLTILQSLLHKVDCLIVGGGIANVFLAANGFSIGHSLSEPELIPEAKKMIEYAKLNNKLLLIPQDVVVSKTFSSQAQAGIKSIQSIDSSDIILDIGPKTIEKIQSIIKDSKTIIWNGPLGVFEWDQFGAGTQALAMAIGQSEAYSVAGGGDTLAAIEKYGVEDQISYISTGGGAFLEFLEGKKLPAISILERRSTMDV